MRFRTAEYMNGVSFNHDQFGRWSVVLFDNESREYFRIYLQGAHIANWHPEGHDPVIWMSPNSSTNPGDPFRGGVPICFPWFGPREGLPLHGFARLVSWNMSDISLEDGMYKLVFTLSASTLTRQFWPHDFELEYTVSVTAPGKTPGLTMDLDIRTDAGCEAALHTYLDTVVSDVVISGLEEGEYWDKQLQAEGRYGTEPIRITGHTDRVHFVQNAVCRVEDVARSRTIWTHNMSGATVLWHPSREWAMQQKDLGDQSNVLCVEAAHCMKAKLAPGGGRLVQLLGVKSY